MSHLLYALEDFFEDRALRAGGPVSSRVFRHFSVAAGGLGGTIDAIVTPLKRIVHRR